MRRHLIVNADDFGAWAGINRGIVEAHRSGIVTSASLMVHRPAARDAAQLARACTDLSVGLHFEEPRERPLDSQRESVASEVSRQLALFRELVGADPTHVDSHHHVHRRPGVREVFLDALSPIGVPLREASPVSYIGRFYAQGREVTELRYVSVEFLQQILRTELTTEWTELGCHPGHVGDGFESGYLSEREAELETLTDPRVRETIAELGIELCNYADYSAATSVKPL